ncbi:hypothetical protein [Flavobacterium psychrotrophum]|uniref:hypothetical protein n=1 Tax=Flavobacterium psychrotrophum TaxID=2294119 RepID=UPI000E30CA94|nr:hypothetical protein [Flavobacterium psychrotrophum]
MKKILSLCLLLIFLTGCEQQPFFDFDNVTHYHSDITQEEFSILKNKNTNDKNFELFSALLWGHYDYPRTIHNTKFIGGVEQFYPVKIEINPDKIVQFKEIFKSNNLKPDVATLCEPFYRDIIVFKKSGQITGIAKLCFGCQQLAIIGTDENAEGFGENGEWKKLQTLLSEKLPEGSNLTEE